jgi:hypothetical protein
MEGWEPLEEVEQGMDLCESSMCPQGCLRLRVVAMEVALLRMEVVPLQVVVQVLGEMFYHVPLELRQLLTLSTRVAGVVEVVYGRRGEEETRSGWRNSFWRLRGRRGGLRRL